ncbi:DUF1947 domain-containing protein [archaeon]|jgi:PUA-domain protein|nr:DUF1947 domain-containing protein [archaeon]MBT5490911.1 DUF1947 domain-containing protein [bacterium]MBT4352507.1 DUF1947 domain-containing protein [archaeon]MBT4648618.1 DUF1947 domain-containing protein [archaeon]MBT6821448.1 DUF1947 domain-containing protein [archaeon]
MRKQLKFKKAKELNNILFELYGFESYITKKDKIEIVEEEGTKTLVLNDFPSFFFHEEKLVPMLKLLYKKNFLKKITIDMGAIKFVCNGADVMRPGITNIEDGIKANDFITIIDETHGKFLSVGIALLSTDGMRSQTGGKVIKNLHFIGDKLWSM